MVVLAAGKSTRMRGPNKLLAKIDGVPMIHRVVRTALTSKVDEVIVVVGWEEEKIRSALEGLGCKIVLNQGFQSGQSSSVRVGVSEIGPASEAVMILPGDVARIDVASINMVIEKYVREHCLIVVAGYKGRSGHPILFDKELFQEIGSINEETFGLKSIVNKHADAVCLVETGSQNVLKDVDTADDLAELR